MGDEYIWAESDEAGILNLKILPMLLCSNSSPSPPVSEVSLFLPEGSVMDSLRELLSRLLIGCLREEYISSIVIMFKKSLNELRVL